MKSKFATNIIGILVVFILAILLFFRLKFGFDQTDESYYYALAKRFYQGDIPFIHEWYPSQIFAVLLCPFYGAYSFFVSSSEGIILAGRYVYLGIQVVVALYSLYIFKDDCFKSVFITVLYMMCTRQNIAGLSYYNLYMTSCFVICLTIYNYLYRRLHVSISFFIIGIEQNC